MATKKIFISGASGRIGRAVTYELTKLHDPSLQIVGINDPVGIDRILESLSGRDPVHGKYDWMVRKEGNDKLSIDGNVVKVFAERDITKIPFMEMGVDLVEECSGYYGDDKKDPAKKPSEIFLAQGVRKVVLSYAANHADKMLVMGVNHHLYNYINDKLVANDIPNNLIANASCTTKALVSPLKVLMDNGIRPVSLLMDTVHAVTNSGNLTSLVNNIAIQKTGAAKATGKVIPELEGKVDGFAMRVPTNDSSFANIYFVAEYEFQEPERSWTDPKFGEITLESERILTAEKINEIFRMHIGDENYCGRIGFSNKKDATSLTDVLGRTENGIVFFQQTRVHKLGDNLNLYHVCIVSGYDNEAAPPRDQALLTQYMLSRE